MRVAAYVRVSDESQLEGYSLEAQRSEIARWCDRRGHSLAAVYAEEGVSAHTERIERRPELSRLLADARRGLFDLVVVHTLDRWARNVGVQRQALQLLGEAHCGFASVTEDIDFASPSGKLMLTMIGGVAEFFSDQLAVHVRKGLHERARQGLHNGSVPFGYRRCGGDEGCPHAGGVHVVEAEAAALREVFSRYAAGAWTQTEAARWLNLQGLRTRNQRDTGHGAEPQPFTTWSIRDIIANPFYAGLVRWNRRDTYPGQHEAIIDAATFQACQGVKIAHRGRSRTFSPTTRPYLLKGLLRCAECGETFWAERGGRQQVAYYRGPRRDRSCACASRSFRAEMIDARMGLTIYALQLPEEWMENARHRAAAERPLLADRKKALEDRRRRLGRAFVDGALADADYQRETAALAAEIAALSNEPRDDGEEARRLLSNLDGLWREANTAERSLLLSAIFDAAYVDAEGWIAYVAPKPSLAWLFEGMKTRPETGVTLTAAVVGMVETGEN